jgi:integrase
MPKRGLEVKCIPVRDLRRKLIDDAGVPVAEVDKLNVGAIRSMCTRMGIDVMQTTSGCPVPLFASSAIVGEELQRELAALRSEHIEKGTRKGHERNQKKMIEWWAGRPEYADLVENGKVKNLATFPVDAFVAFLLHQVDADLSVVNGKRMLIGSGGLANYRKAFSNMFDESSPPCFQSEIMVREIQKNMKALKKRHAKEARSSERKSKVGKEEIPYGLLLSIAKIFLEEGMFWEHAYAMLCWDLMARSDNVGDLTVKHLKFVGDSLNVLFSSDKTHTDGEGMCNKEPKHCYANSTDASKCLLVALGLYLLSSPDVGVKSNKLFPGAVGTQKHRFRDRFNDGLKQHRVRQLLERYGLEPEDIGPHSFRKGAGTYCSSGCTGGPSIVAILMRGGWEIGQVLDRYLRYSEAGDEFVGRVISGLPLSETSFTAPPPHFKAMNDAEQEELQKVVKLLFPCAKQSAQAYPVAEKLLASVLHAIPELLGDDKQPGLLPLGSEGRKAFLATPLMRDAKIREQWAKYVIVEDPKVKVSGVPTWHTMLAAVIETLTTCRGLPALIRADLLAELDARDRASGTVSVFVLQQELKKTKDDCVAECVAEMRSMRKELLEQMSGSGKVNGDEGATVKGGRYWWCNKGSDQPTIHRLPMDFKLDLCSVKIAFGLYFQGKEDPKDPQMRYPPYRTLKHYDVPNPNCYKMLSGWRNCFDVDADAILRDNEAWKRAVRDLKAGKAAELADVEDMWEACAPLFASMLGGHRRPEEAKMSTLVTRRYEAYAKIGKD